MIQIKTIRNTDPAAFDAAVNAALADGWALTRRLMGPGPDFVAEMAREVITEKERTCENCKYLEQPPEAPPCCDCSRDCDKWEAPET